MQHVRSAMFWCGFLLMAGSAFPGGAVGQGPGPDLLDHLICYQMRDPLSAEAKFDLLARIQPEFSRRGCTLVVDSGNERVRSQFCVPASKLNVEAPGHDPDAAVGVPLFNDYVCYRVRCDEAPRPPDKTVVDQFGDRHARFGRPVRVCVPAVKRPVACGRMDNMGKQCGGDCPAGQRCRSNGAMNDCACAPVPCGGSPDAAGMCGGSCPEAGELCVRNAENRCVCEPRGCGIDEDGTCGGPCPDPEQTCELDSAGLCRCQPPIDACRFDADTEECGGPCPPGSTCRPVGMMGECACLSEPGECGFDPDGQCGGACPNPSETCAVAGGACRCLPTPGECGVDPITGECAGACMVATDVCRPFNNGECRCQPPQRTCAMDDNGQCGGACPSAGDVCLPTDDDTCECQPPPATGECGRDRETRECAGDCPDGLICVPHSNGVCRCESPDGCTLDPMSGQCGGMCPKGKECRTQETPAGTFCRCVGPQAKLRGPRD